MPAKPRPEPSCQYPDDAELARVLLGDRAKRWPEIVVIEERHGFPRLDPLYGGRYWPAVQAFYARRAKIDPPATKAVEVEETRGETFRDRSRKARGL
jgi:hypothetical protein